MSQNTPESRTGFPAYLGVGIAFFGAGLAFLAAGQPIWVAFLVLGVVFAVLGVRGRGTAAPADPDTDDPAPPSR